MQRQAGLMRWSMLCRRVRHRKGAGVWAVCKSEECGHRDRRVEELAAGSKGNTYQRRVALEMDDQS